MFNGEINEERKTKCLDLCSNYLGGRWSTISSDQFSIKLITGGFINTKYLCEIADDQEKNENKNKSKNLRKLVIHFKGNELSSLQPLVNLSKNEIEEALIAEQLGRLNIGPKIYGFFDGGRLEEFFEFKTLKHVDFDNKSVLKNLAKRFAEMHSLSFPLSKEIPFFNKTNNSMISNINLRDINEFDEDVREVIQKLFQLPLKEEISWLLETSKKVKSPILFTHNDPSGNNIFLTFDGQIKFVDWDFTSYNYRAYDISYIKMMRNHEFGFENGLPEFKTYEENTDIDFDRDFLTYYLQEFKSLTIDSNDIDLDEFAYDFDHLKMEVDFFSLSVAMNSVVFMISFLNTTPIEILQKFKTFFTSESYQNQNPTEMMMQFYLDNKIKFIENHKYIFK